MIFNFIQPSKSAEFKNIDQEKNIVGIVFDSEGNYLLDIGKPEDNYGVNQLENIFEFDYNKDSKKGGLIEEVISQEE